ncbi:MAG: hypothetical protein AAGD07_17795, partial [Planctomycetota bacterium]
SHNDGDQLVNRQLAVGRIIPELLNIHDEVIITSPKSANTDFTVWTATSLACAVKFLQQGQSFTQFENFTKTPLSLCCESFSSDSGLPSSTFFLCT